MIRTRNDWWRIASGALLSLYVFAPKLLGDAIPMRAVAIALAVFALSLEIWLSDRELRRRVWTIACIAVGSGLTLGLAEFVATTAGDRTIAVNAEHLFLLAPLLGALGWAIIRQGSWRPYAAMFLVVAAVNASFSVVESSLGQSLLGRPEFATSQREGPTRALLASEHVLVLGALLATAVPLAALPRVAVRTPLTLLLLVGCWSTGSRAAALLSTAVALMQAIPPLTRLLQRFAGYVAVALVGAFAVLGWLAVAVWTPYIAGDTGVEYSANYRLASYALLPDILLSQPIGYLLGKVPTGDWMMESELRGPVDLAHSADSEILFAAFALGWIGVAAFFVALVVSVLAIRRLPALGLATTLLTSLGVIMSLHAWDAASLPWYLLLGASCAANFRYGDRGANALKPRVIESRKP